jgi:hypothetical protein
LPPLKSVKVLDQRREGIRCLHYSIRTEDVYVHWVRTFIRFRGLRHAAILGGGKVEAFRSWLASASNVTASAQAGAVGLAVLLTPFGISSKPDPTVCPLNALTALALIFDRPRLPRRCGRANTMPLPLVTGVERSCAGHCPEETIAGEVFVWITVGRISSAPPPAYSFSPYETPACRNSTPCAFRRTRL